MTKKTDLTDAGRVLPVRFAVDDVAQSTEMLPTAELLRVVQKTLNREVLQSAGMGRRVVDLRISDNPLVAAVHLAFSRHLPLTLSPDTIWLTIVQGFSHHVNENAAALRRRMVRHEGSLTLTERVTKLNGEELQAAVAGFSSQIRDHTDPVVHETLLCDFTTTTPDVRTASEIAIMDTYSQYFEFLMVICICGIPEITLTGTVQDWQRIRDRVEVLGTFGLDWWVTRLRPILQQFVDAAEGRVDRKFWRAIYKWTPSTGGPYVRDKVTGWLVNLFPYLGDTLPRRRSHVFEPGEKPEVASGAFPSGLCSVPVMLHVTDAAGNILNTRELDLVAGLVGVEQAEDAALSPAVSWCLADRAPQSKQRKAPIELL